MTTMLEKCKALAKKTHQSSSVANQALKDKCKSMGVKFAKLQNPNQTRWNSQLTNMESVLRPSFLTPNGKNHLKFPF